MTGVDPVDFLEEAVATPSHESVGAMRELLVDVLAAHGADPVVGEGGSVVASRGPGRPHLVLNTHLDTVAPHVPSAREGDRLAGRGACDAKGPLAAMVDAFLRRDPDEGRVTLAVTPDEETTSAGAAALVLGDDPVLETVDAVVVGEPTGLDACVAARGRFQGEVVIEGSPAHAADPAAGANAVSGLGPVLAALESFDRQRGPPTHELLGSPTLEPTVVEGGEATNRIPAESRLTFDRRSVPPETADAFREALAAHVREAVDDDLAVAVTFEDRSTPFLEPFATDPEAAVVRSLLGAGAGEPRPFGAATEASYFARRAPTVVFGPGQLFDAAGPVAHAEREYVQLPAVERAADVLADAVASFPRRWDG